MCEAISNKGQFFIVKNDQYTQNNIFTFVTIVNCGPKNVGHSSIIINEDSNFEFTYINSSNNYNSFSDKSYGTCFTTEFVKSFKVEHFNFLRSTGIDIINTHDIPMGTFKSGNIQNCSTDYIFKYRGDITFLDTYFDKNTYRINSFFHSGPDFISTKINFTNCHFDVKPAGIIMDASNVEDNPLITTLINGLENLDKCPIPSDRFTLSDDFTLSNVFTCSSEFTRSKYFSPSIEFSSSKSFTASSQFSESKTFSPSIEFTRSNYFSPSIEFTRSKYFSPSIEFSSSKSFTASAQFSDSKSFSPSSQFSESKIFTPSSQFSKSKSFTASSQFSESKSFTASSQFTKSNYFTHSIEFSSSKIFGQTSQFMCSKSFTFSSQFSKSNFFSPTISFTFSSNFTNSNPFSPSKVIFKTSTFTPSSAFTPSFTFSPNATKYPDGLGGYDRAQVSGGRLNDPPSAVAIGATAGISFVLIAVAVALMIIYLRSKQKQLHRQVDLAEEFLYDSTEQSTSYSYSYYTFEYEYYEPSDLDEEYNDEFTYDSFNYSDFKGT